MFFAKMGSSNFVYPHPRLKTGRRAERGPRHERASARFLLVEDYPVRFQCGLGEERETCFALVHKTSFCFMVSYNHATIFSLRSQVV